MKRIPTKEVKERTREITEYFRSYKPYEDRLGQVYSVLCTEVSHDNQYYVAHNQFYEQVLVPMRPELMGKMFSVRIVDSCKFSMTGELLQESTVVRPAPADPLRQGQVSGIGAGAGAAVWMVRDKSQIFVTSVLVLILAAVSRIIYLLWIW